MKESKITYNYSGNLKIDDLNLFYIDIGSGYPLVLIHGMGSDHTIWEGLIPLLQNDYRVIAMDLRGHGCSSKNSGPYSMKLFSEDIYLLLEKLNVRQAHFIGHSMGGTVLQELAIDNPGIILSLIFISSFSYINHQLEENLIKLREILNKKGYNAFFDACLEIAHNPQYVIKNKGLLEDFRDKMAINNSISSLTSAINACLKVDYIDSLNKVKVPSLVIAGEEDRFVSVNQAIKISARIPNSEINIIPSASHNMLVEQPLETYKLVKNYLDEF